MAQCFSSNLKNEMNMKRFQKIIGVLFIVMMSLSYSANAQFVVHVRPARPHYVRVVAPSPRHVWIDEDWEWRNGAYVFVGGHWVEPPRKGGIWVTGHWRRRPNGWTWVPGHWRW
jgi:hypothetical protein